MLFIELIQRTRLKGFKKREVATAIFLALGSLIFGTLQTIVKYAYPISYVCSKVY